jgi:hypothetical protein
MVNELAGIGRIHCLTGVVAPGEPMNRPGVLAFEVHPENWHLVTAETVGILLTIIRGEKFDVFAQHFVPFIPFALFLRINFPSGHSVLPFSESL